MEAAEGAAGIICRGQDALQIVRALRAYVDDAPEPTSTQAYKALLSAESVYSVQPGFDGEVFIRADAALLARERLQAETRREKFTRWLGYFSACWWASAETDNHIRTLRERHALAHNIGQTVRKSISVEAHRSSRQPV
jgi:hypothetical protein